MKLVLFVFAAMISMQLSSQDIFSDEDARSVIDTFFEGFHKGDTTIIRSVLHDEVVMQTVFTDAEGNHRLVDSEMDDLLKAIAERPETQKWDERLLDYSIQIDGNLAQVWTPYEFWLNDTFSHCGANAFTLIRTDAGWRILHLIDSRRRQDCGE
jgi:hypothetical protein